MRLDEGPEAEASVVSAFYASACCLDGGDGGLRGTRDDEVDRGGEELRAFAEDLDAIFERVDATGLVKLLGSDRARRIQKPTVDPVLDLIKVDRHVCLAMTERERKRTSEAKRG